MKKKDIVDLIRFYSENDDDSFRKTAFQISKEFNDDGDHELSDYIDHLLSDAYSMVPQNEEGSSLGFLSKQRISISPLYLPGSIKDDLLGVVNSTKRNLDTNRFLFYGAPGSGKTEAANQVARILKRDLWSVNITELIDSKLGETAKNIASLFDSIEKYPFKRKMVVLFDEIDGLATSRIDSQDLREMGRATTSLLKGLDSLSPEVVLIATTNLYSSFDKALLRRFSAKIDFSRYSKKDLREIGIKLFQDLSKKVPDINPNYRLVSKIISLMNPIPYPGEMRNIISTSLAFSDPNNQYDYAARLLKEADKNDDPFNLQRLKSEGFSLREIQALTSISKSGVARRIKK